MTAPTSAQLREARATNQMAVSGAHTVGAPDGGAGLPGVGWSRDHGDLRVPHFLGLHALQTLPLLVVLLRRLGANVSVRMTQSFAASHAALFGILLVQALRGEALVAPSLLTTVLFGGWTVGTTVALLVTAPRRDAALSPSAMTEA